MANNTTRPFLVDLIHDEHSSSHLHFIEEQTLISDSLMLMLENAFKHKDVGMIIAHKQVSTSKKAIETIVARSKTYRRNMIVLDIEKILTGNAAYQVVRYNPLRGKSLLQALKIVCSVFMETESNERDKLNIIQIVYPLLKQQISETVPHLTLRKLLNETIKLSETSLNPTSKYAVDGLLKAFSILDDNNLIDRLTDDINDESFNFADIILNNKIGVIKSTDTNQTTSFKHLKTLATADLLETFVDILDHANRKILNGSFRRYFFADLKTLFNPMVMPVVMRYSRKIYMQSHVFLNYQDLPLSPDGSQEEIIVNNAYNRIYQATSPCFPHYKANLWGKQEHMKKMLDPNTIHEQKLPLNTVLFCCNHLPSPELLSFKDFYGAA
ncbi:MULTISPECIES: hypothetical protein [Acinetobacter]|uniref:Uncharacterized protein n=1 Tax=Acinetobacter indicus TaxID=756892 RepID=A0A6C0Y7B4_9GAMM|nr:MULTISPECIES: hypothetical protein [Acinetobacter]QIC72068.1 hypothetical protein FSC09_17065 [Acinetobacter indicus]QKQ71531.1 hypothetical protein E5Y90_14965 [Acinetobacter sp. 10FS3-1]